MQIKTDHLKAALLCAAKKDIRYYLNGVFIEITPTGGYLVATNGHIMLVGKLPIDEDCLPQGGYIISWGMVEAAIKGCAKSLTLTLSVTETGEVRLGNVVGKLADAKYAAWRKVTPTDLTAGDVSQINPDYLVACRNALRLFSDTPEADFAVMYRGKDVSAVMASAEAFCVLLPMRMDSGPDKLPFDLGGSV